MRNVLLLFCIAFCVQTTVAQKLEMSLSGAFAVGDGRDFTTTGFMAEVGLMPKVAPKLQLGGQVGFLLLPGKEIEFSDYTDAAPSQQFVSLAGAARLDIAKGFKVEADIGYAFGVNKTDQFDSVFGIPIENVNGFYYSPKLLYEVTDRVLALLAYRAIALDGFDWQVISAGITVRIL
ncbi:MAG: hypothetical protein ABJM06_08325 [Gilvibacter sp.]